MSTLRKRAVAAHPHNKRVRNVVKHDAAPSKVPVSKDSNQNKNRTCLRRQEKQKETQEYPNLGPKEQ